MKRLCLLLGISALLACQQSPSTNSASGSSSKKITANLYKQQQATQALVLLTINWGTKWRCGGYDSTYLQEIRFSRLNGSDADLLFKRDNHPQDKPDFVRYAVLVDPGEYALSATQLTVIQALGQKTDQLVTDRSRLIAGDQVLGGSFTADAGEQVYVGNFWIDCKYAPIVWRYYTEGQDSFTKHMALFAQDYPFVDPQKVQYRLFKTNQFGLDYQLPVRENAE